MSNQSSSMNGVGDRTGTATDRAHEIYEQLLRLGQEFAAAYVDAYQKTAAGIAELQDRVENTGWSGIRPGGQPWSATADAAEPLRNARRQATEIGDKLQEMNKKIMLAYLNASELAALAVTDCQEELAAASGLELVKSVGGARVEFKREMTKVYLAAAREIVG